jgi:hypothetical protein
MVKAMAKVDYATATTTTITLELDVDEAILLRDIINGQTDCWFIDMYTELERELSKPRRDCINVTPRKQRKARAAGLHD